APLVRGSRDRSEGAQAQAILERKLIMARSSRHRFAVCIETSGYRASLERHKIYRVLPDKDAADDGDLRVIVRGRTILARRSPPKVVRVLNRSFASSTSAR